MCCIPLLQCPVVLATWQVGANGSRYPFSSPAWLNLLCAADIQSAADLLDLLMQLMARCAQCEGIQVLAFWMAQDRMT